MITLVSALSVREPMIRVANVKEQSSESTKQAMVELLKRRKKWCNFGEARDLDDLSVILHALGAVDHAEEVGRLSINLSEANQLCMIIIRSPQIFCDN